MILMILSRRTHRPVGSVSASVLHCHGSQGGGASGLSVSEPVRRCLGSFGKPRMARRANEESPGLVGQREMEFVYMCTGLTHAQGQSLFSSRNTSRDLSSRESSEILYLITCRLAVGSIFGQTEPAIASLALSLPNLFRTNKKPETALDASCMNTNFLKLSFVLRRVSLGRKTEARASKLVLRLLCQSVTCKRASLRSSMASECTEIGEN